MSDLAVIDRPFINLRQTSIEMFYQGWENLLGMRRRPALAGWTGLTLQRIAFKHPWLKHSLWCFYPGFPSNKTANCSNKISLTRSHISSSRQASIFAPKTPKKRVIIALSASGRS